MRLIDVINKIKRAKRELQGLIEEATIIFVDLAGSTDYKVQSGLEQGWKRL